jgi:hypothetical protein
LKGWAAKKYDGLLYPPASLALTGDLQDYTKQGFFIGFSACRASGISAFFLLSRRFSRKRENFASRDTPRMRRDWPARRS